MSLVTRQCVPCRADSLKVTEKKIAELHLQIPQWKLTNVDGINRLTRTFKFRNFLHALNFTMRVGEAAEAEGHHPKLTIEWGKVTVEWWTHKIKDLHQNDFIMAAKTDKFYSDTPRATA